MKRALRQAVGSGKLNSFSYVKPSLARVAVLLYGYRDRVYEYMKSNRNRQMLHPLSGGVANRRYAA